MTHTQRTASLGLLIALILTPSVASADLFTFWAAGKGNTFNGSGDLFQNFDNRFGGGAEAGIEIVGLDIFGEAVVLGLDQYLFSANLGLDFSVGDDIRLTLGAFTGPLFFLFPEPEEATGATFSGLSAEQQLAIEQQFGSIEEAEEQFNQFSETEKDLSRVAVGYNIVRARADVDVRLAPGIYLGLTGQAGYHLLLSGEEIAAGAKNEAVEGFAKDNNLPDEVTEALRSAVGAEPIDKKNLEGFNLEVQLHLRIELGT